jgi:hypothetical protein
MADRNAQLKVTITGDTKGLDRATRSASNSLGKLGKDTTLHARVTGKGFSAIGVAARGMGAAGIAGAAGVGFLVKQFEDSNKIAKQTQAVLKSTGGEANVTAKQVSNLATAISRKTGIDDEAVQSSENMLLTFTNVRNEVGKGNNIFTRATRTVQDMSVALGQDGKSSAIQLGKALNDPIKGITALQRVGVSFTADQKKQITALVDSGHAMQAQKLILRELNKEFGGSAAAQATPFDKLKVSAGNLAETLGGHLAPILGKAANALNKFLNQMQDGTGAGGKFVSIVRGVAAAVGKSVGRISDYWRDMTAAVRGFIHRNQDTIDALGKAVSNIAKAIKAVIENVLIPAFKKWFAGMKQVVSGALEVLGGLIKFISNVFAGRWGKAWEGLKEIVKGAFKAFTGVIKTFVTTAFSLAKNIGSALVKGILAGLAGLGKALANKVGSAIKGIPGAISGAAQSVGKALISPFGDGVGKAYASSTLPVGVTGGAFGLQGARPVMGTFAREGARFGLNVSSGRTGRENTLTSSGNVSWHSTGEAIDLSNGYATPQELAFARYEVAHHGSQLAELIHTPLGFGIKDGRRVPLSYWGPTINAQHMNHVHVAYDSGKPGIGDGTGRGDGTGNPVINTALSVARQVGAPRQAVVALLEALYAESGARNLNYGDASSTGPLQVLSSTARGMGINARNVAQVVKAFLTRGYWGKGSAITLANRSGLNAAQIAHLVQGNRTGAGVYSAQHGRALAALAGWRGGGGSGGGGAVATRPKGTAYGKLGGELVGPISAGVVGVSPNGGPIISSKLNSYADTLDADEALASLTSTTADDLRVANIRVHDARVALRKAKKSGKAKRIATAAQNLRSALDTRNGLRPSADGGTDTGSGDTGGGDNQALIDAINTLAQLEQQRIDLETQMTANQTKLIALANTQGPNLLAAVISAMSGDIGGRIGLGSMTPGWAGGVART